MTKKSATALAGLGLMGVAKDNYPHDGDTYSFVVGLRGSRSRSRNRQDTRRRLPGGRRCRHGRQPAQPARPAARRINLGIGHALQQKWVYDPHYGVPLAKRFYHNKPLTILDIPARDGDRSARTWRIPRRRSARAESASRRSAPVTVR